MTNTRLFDKLRALLQDANNADKKHIKKIRKVLRKLKQRQSELRDSLEDNDDPQLRKKIEQEIEVINLQRLKGLEVCRQLKEARELAKRKKREKRLNQDNTG